MSQTGYNKRKLYSTKNLMNLCLALIAAGVTITAMKWPFKTALFPLAIGISVFLMAVTELLLSLFEREGKAAKQSAMDFKLSEGIDEAVALRRTWVAFGWIIGFFFLILFLGFSIAVPLFVFFYLRLYGKEKWGISIIMTVSSYFFFWGLFVWLLNTPLMEGWIFRGLRAIGIG
ncbi:MAG: tripartite tricarboxylate transporter TctB family protein [Thermodesulfobacteriota bacterium]|nr:tripartite tricarboxylate transporter TctB family protein [Thermodesulfobacteriota bacterium]